MSRRGVLIVVSGFAGAGKGTIIKELLKKHDNYALSVSATTRSPRVGEEEGKDYFFIKTDEEFEELIKTNKLLEYARYVNNYYGTPRDYVKKTLSEGKDVILEIEIQGALEIKERFEETVMIFIMPPSAKELKDRLIKRATETKEVIEARLKRALEETAVLDKYDYLLVNEEIETCAKEFHDIIMSEHKKVVRNLDLVEKIRQELESF